MRIFFRMSFVAVAVIFSANLIAQKPQACVTAMAPPESQPVGSDNIAYKWSEVVIKATALDTERFRPRPTITSRYLALIFTSMFDAWSRYDEKATPVYLSGIDRRPSQEQTISSKEIAVSFAAYRTLCEYFYSDSAYFREFMVSLGYDPDNRSMDPRTPEGIGNLAAHMTIEARKHDGSNQYGEESASGIPYEDYSGYTPVNTADVNVDINRWQPIYFADGKGGKWLPKCATPFWGKVKPIAIKSSDQFRPGPPPMVGSPEMNAEVEQVVNLQANLSPEEKALVEFMRDGPNSVQQAGHWLKFAQDVSVRDNHTLDEDVKMYFIVEVAAMDAFIACWDAKFFYDSARPYALVHHYYKDKKIKCWGGEESGMCEIKGEEWRPYSPATFVCPPFPGYTSGHSTASGSCSEVLKLFTGSDEFGKEVELIPGSLTEPERAEKSVILKLSTFSGTADMAGFSRVLGGYHIQSDNEAGLKLGRDVAHEVWQFYLAHVGG